MRWLIGALMVGVVGVAGAQPALTKPSRPAGTVSRYEVALAAMDIQHDDTAEVPRGAGPLRGVRIRALHGGAYIEFVEVLYASGERQRVTFGRQLGRDESADVDLNGRRTIQAITVRGTPDLETRIQVVGIR